MPAQAVRRFLPSDIWNDYFKFAIDRNPFDRVISDYHWSQSRPSSAPMDIGSWIEQRVGRLSNWPVYAVDDTVLVDHLGKYEDLANEVAKISKRIGTQVELPPTRMKGQIRQDQRHYSEVLDRRSRDIIEQECRREIQLLGYRWSAS